MERRRSVALRRPQTPPIRPIPVRTGSSASPTVRFSPSPTRAPSPARASSPALSRSSAGALPPRPLSRIGTSPAPARPTLPRPSSYTSSVVPRPPSPARSSSFPPLARLSAGPPVPPLSVSKCASTAQSTLARPRLSVDTRRSSSLPRPPSAVYTSRRSGLATPPPSRPSSGSSSTSFRAVPAHLGYIDPSIPPLPFNPSEHPEGSTLARSNLYISRGKPRLGLSHWEQGAAYRMHQALEAYAGEFRQQAARAREGGSAAIAQLRLEVYMPVRALFEAATAILRLLKSSEPGMRIGAQVASRLVYLRWGDNAEWQAILTFHKANGVEPIVISQQNTGVVCEYTQLAVQQFEAFPRLAKLTADLHACVTRLYDSWQIEFDGPVSIRLRRLAQERGDRKAWQELQWRAEAYASGLRATADAKRRLARELGRFLDGVRGRSGISGDDYLEFYQRMQPFLPDGEIKPRKELCPR